MGLVPKTGDPDAAVQVAREAALMEAVRAQLRPQPRPQESWLGWAASAVGLASPTPPPSTQSSVIQSPPMFVDPFDPQHNEPAVVGADFATTIATRIAEEMELASHTPDRIVQPILDEPIDAVLVSPPLQPAAAALPNIEKLDDSDDEAEILQLPPNLIVEADALAVEEQRIEALRIEEQRIEALRIEEQRIEALRIEEQRIEALRIEEQRIEALRIEEQRIEQARMEALAAVERQQTLLVQQQREREEAAQQAILDAAADVQRTIAAGRAAGF